MGWGPSTGGTGGGFRAGPADNFFGATSGSINTTPLTILPAASRAAAETVRDDYFTTNPSNLVTYDATGNEALGVVIYFTDGGELITIGQTRVGGAWRDSASTIAIQGLPGSGAPNNRVNVVSASDLAGQLDSTKDYFIDGAVDMGSQSIEVPAGGLSLSGFNFDVSRLFSSADNYTMFVSPVGGSGNIIGMDYDLMVTGANSKIYDIKAVSGGEAFEFSRINYTNCVSLGSIDNYRQGLEIGTGRLGGAPSLELIGAWSGGYRVTTSIVRGLDSGMTEPLFKAGAGFEMQSRFLTDINIDLPPLAALFDFSSTNFPNPSTLQVQGAIVTRGGASDATDANITPNIEPSELASSWSSNNGMPNTFVGGSITNTAEVVTNIVSQNVAVDLNGTFSTSDLQHFDSPASGRLRHLGSTPRDFSIDFDFVIDGKDNDNYQISLVKIDTLGAVTIEYQQTRTINNLQGGRDVGYFGGVADVILNKNDFIFWRITNLLDSDDCTLEIGSQWRVKAR